MLMIIDEQAEATVVQFEEQDFLPLKPAQLTHEWVQSTRPSLSSSQDAWLRFKKNKRALYSLWTLVCLLLFTVFGPLLWTVEAAHQDLDQTSQAPHFGKDSLIVGDDFHWPGITIETGITIEPGITTENLTAASSTQAPTQVSAQLPASALGAVQNLRVIDQANTEFVRLAWEPVLGASRYLVYRHERPPLDVNDLGVPLWESNSAVQISYQDRLKLEAITYYYSVIASDGVEESSHFAVIKVTVKQATTFSDAIYSGILPSDAQPEKSIGHTVKLAAHPFGTDYLGRDMLSRLMLGAQTSLFIGIVAPLIFLSLGIIYGSIAGFNGGLIDDGMMRVADFVIALPFLLFMILFKVAFGIGPGQSGVLPMLVAMILLSWPGAARLVRGQVLRLREEPYIAAAKLLGAGKFYLIWRHMVPNLIGVVLVSFTFAIPSAIFTEAFLSFIGMGVVPPTPSWGSMSNDGMKTFMIHPHELLFPAIFISITVLAFNLLGDGLRDALDSRLREN